MTLSGWARLWVVASVIWWAASFAWMTFEPNSVMPAVFFNPSDYCPAPCDAAKLDGVSATWRDGWAVWFRSSWESGQLPLVLFLPFGIGAITWGGRWIARGFGQKVG